MTSSLSKQQLKDIGDHLRLMAPPLEGETSRSRDLPIPNSFGVGIRETATNVGGQWQFSYFVLIEGRPPIPCPSKNAAYALAMFLIAIFQQSDDETFALSVPTSQVQELDDAFFKMVLNLVILRFPDRDAARLVQIFQNLARPGPAFRR